MTFSTLTLGPWLLEDEDDAEGGTSKGDDNDVELLEDFLKGSAAGGVAPKGEIPGNPGGVPSPANNEFGPPILGAAAAVSLVCKRQNRSISSIKGHLQHHRCIVMHFPTTSQCGNFNVFLSVRFYVKSTLGILQVQNLPF